MSLLCVDDDSQCLEIRRLLLEAYGFSVETCTDPRQGLRMLSKKKFDAAVLDYQMPVMNGAELAKQMKAVRSDLPIMILSGLDRLPENTPVFYDRFLCKTESSHKIAGEIELLIGPPKDEGGLSTRPSFRHRFLAMGAASLGIVVEAVSNIRHTHQPRKAAIHLKSMAAGA